MRTIQPFHLAFPIRDIEETRDFYQDLLGCEIGRSTENWIDFNFFGHQLSAHVKPEELTQAKANQVDGKNVPVRHFGVILPWEEWHSLAEKLKKNRLDFIVEPYIRFKGEVGEQATMFFLDPSGNALEFKSFQDPDQIFAS
ncbi:VOC family protein [Pleomorphovibrio marinus]|uniref:VOC family protein n=1 Tax=Pleomorphovibrio marinus TaxID=2164132 RepID=UPI000E0C454F|nr:VOC family protein [Pleomorphovibrio marinus]